MKLGHRILGSWYDNSWVKLICEFVFFILPVGFAIRTFIFGFYLVPTGSMETTLLVGERFLADKLSYWFVKPKRGDIIAFNEPLYPYSKNPYVNWWERNVSWNVSNWTKRVIGIPGDHVKGVVENGRTAIYLNGVKLDESAYVNKLPLIYLRKRVPSGIFPGFIGGYREKDMTVTFEPNVAWDQQTYYKIDPQTILLRSNGQPVISYPYTPYASGEDVFEHTLGENEYWVMGDNRLGSSDARSFGKLDGKLIHGKIVFRVWSMDTDEQWLPIDLIKNPIKFFYKVRWNRCFQFIS